MNGVIMIKVWRLLKMNERIELEKMEVNDIKQILIFLESVFRGHTSKRETFYAWRHSKFCPSTTFTDLLFFAS